MGQLVPHGYYGSKLIFHDRLESGVPVERIVWKREHAQLGVGNVIVHAERRFDGGTPALQLSVPRQHGGASFRGKSATLIR